MTDDLIISSDNFATFVGRMSPLLDERERRLFAGSLANMLGRGGLKRVSELTGMSRVTVRKGQAESEDLPCDPKLYRKGAETESVRQAGAGRKSITERAPGILEAIRALLDGHVVGNPENPLCWTTKSTYTLSKLLQEQGVKVSPNTVGKLLKDDGFSLQQNRKYVEKGEHSVDRDRQFRFIKDLVSQFIVNADPVISVDTKKKELVGNYKNNGKEYRPKQTPRMVNAHDFEGEGGKAAPYGIYDIAANEGFVNVGISADTAEFAAFSIKRWWEEMGKTRYPEARRLMITADGGGSNSSRGRLWKVELQKLANELGLDIYMSHFPPGTSKWNKIEHRLFAQISRNWRGKPLETLEVIVSLIASTTTNSGLVVKCALDDKFYEKGIKVSDDEMKSINIERCEWRGDWNYIIRPQPLKS